MKTLTWEQAAEWATAAGLNATVKRLSGECIVDGKKKAFPHVQKSIHFPEEEPANRLTLFLPKLPYQVSYLANDLLPYSENAEFQTCLLWITDWGIWSDTSERVANELVQSFRATHGETKPLMETPAHLFGRAEAAQAQTLLTIAIVFGWDCYAIPAHGNYYAFTSHDEYIAVVSSNSAIHEPFAKYLKRWYSEEK